MLLYGKCPSKCPIDLALLKGVFCENRVCKDLNQQQSGVGHVAGPVHRPVPFVPGGHSRLKKTEAVLRTRFRIFHLCRAETSHSFL